MQLQVGTTLGPYRILALLGAGGMGEVYRATDSRLGREVAVKVLADRLRGSAEQRARFHREARVISALNHPHICKLFDLGQSPTTEYLVLELLDGETLQARLGRGALPLTHALRFGSQMADALADAHRLGVVHRDFKPGNIMLTAMGVKLLDFGLAKSVGSAVQLAETIVDGAPATAAGTILGTLQYMAPEQVQGLDADARSDLFALGTVLHEMVTGRKAFEGTNPAALVANILVAEPAPVSSLVAAAPPALDRLIERCLAKDPAERWHSAHDVRLQLDWLQSQGPLAHGGGTPHGGPPPESRLQPDSGAGPPPSLSGVQLRRVRPAHEQPLPAQPYPLLDPCTHPSTFAGRDVEVAALASSVTLAPLVLCVHAASGTGKSSLLLAGLVPHLRAEGFALSIDRAPGDPLLAQRLVRDLFDPAEAIALLDEAADLPEIFARWVARAHVLSGKPIVFVLDQIDDVLRNVVTRDRALARIGPLLAATAQRIPGAQGFACKWVLCYRHEFHGEVRAWLANVLAQARALGASGLETLPFDLSDAQKSHDWVLPVMGRPRPGGGVDTAKDAFLRAIVSPLEQVDKTTGRRYPYLIPQEDAERLAAAFVGVRQAQPDAPLVPELQVVLGHLLQQARHGVGSVSEGKPLVIAVPAADQLKVEIRHALATHVERALETAFPQGRQTASRLSARTRALIALRQLADAKGRRGEGLPEDDVIRMIGTDGRQVLDRLSSADIRLVVTDEGRCALSHDELAKVVTDILASRGPILLDQELLDLHVRIGQKLVLHESDAQDASALSLTRRQRQRIRENADALLHDVARRRWWEAAEATRRRRTWNAALRAAAAAVVVVLAATFYVRAYRATAREATISEALNAIGRDSPDLDRLLDVGDRTDILIEVVERGYKEWVNSTERFGAMSFALEEAWLRTEDRALKRQLYALAGTVRTAFITYHKGRGNGFSEPPASADRDGMNAWKTLDGGEFLMGAEDLTDDERPPHRVRVSAFSIQQREVTNEEYLRFDPARRFREGEEKHPVGNVTWYQAVAYAAWLGGSLPTEAEWEYAARGTRRPPSAAKQGRLFPWGDEPPTAEHAVVSEAKLEAVGSRPRGQTPDGLDDMAGNAWEWCRDWSGPYVAQVEQAILDPLGPPDGERRVIRGGSFYPPPHNLRAAGRHWFNPDENYRFIGFRVVSSRFRR